MSYSPLMSYSPAPWCPLRIWMVRYISPICVSCCRSTETTDPHLDLYWVVSNFGSLFRDTEKETCFPPDSRAWNVGQNGEILHVETRPHKTYHPTFLCIPHSPKMAGILPLNLLKFHCRAPNVVPNPNLLSKMIQSEITQHFRLRNRWIFYPWKHSMFGRFPAS